MFSLDGTQLASAGSDNVVRVWNVEMGKELAALTSSDAVTVVAFSPDDTFLAAGSEDGSVRIWAMKESK